jgi:hypothetical protein
LLSIAATSEKKAHSDAAHAMPAVYEASAWDPSAEFRPFFDADDGRSQFPITPSIIVDNRHSLGSHSLGM